MSISRKRNGVRRKKDLSITIFKCTGISRFKPSHDIHLLKEVMQYALCAAPHGKMTDAWEEVANLLTPLLARKINHAAVKRRGEDIP